MAQFSSPKVIIAEDDPTNRVIVSHLCKNLGLDAVLASNGAEAMYHYLRSEPISFVFLDIMMPEVGGREFLEMLESMYHRRLLMTVPRVIVVSSVSDIKVLSEIAAFESVLAVIQKPIPAGSYRLIRDIINQELLRPEHRESSPVPGAKESVRLS